MGGEQSPGRGPEWGAGCESGEQAAALSSARGGGEGRARRAEWETKRKEGKSVPRLQRVLDTREFVLQAEGLA